MHLKKIAYSFMSVVIAVVFTGCFKEDESKQGMVRITTDPGNAQLFVDGERKGNSPTEVGQSFAIKLKEGSYTISAKKADGIEYEYVGKKEDLFIAAETMQSVVLKLERIQTPEGMRLEDERAYEKASSTNTSASYKEYIKNYPDGKFVDDARKLAETRAYEKASSTDTSASYKAYVKNYPDGKFVDKAKKLAETRAVEEEEKRKAEEAKRKAEEAKRKAEEAKRKKEEAERDAKAVFIDSAAKLMWQDSKITAEKNGEKNWDDGNSYCQNLSHAGYSDWRLPTINELKELYEKKGSLKNVASFTYWSSSKYTSFLGTGFKSVKFRNGDTAAYHKSNKYYVRCVRGRQ